MGRRDYLTVALLVLVPEAVRVVRGAEAPYASVTLQPLTAHDPLPHLAEERDGAW